MDENGTLSHITTCRSSDVNGNPHYRSIIYIYIPVGLLLGDLSYIVGIVDSRGQKITPNLLYNDLFGGKH